MLENGFPSVYDTVRKYFEIISYNPKLADFEQNAWAIAHGFE